ncbi:MAG TPA: DUF3943 domain-containing protein, partial [Candidatus Krumholzibacteria bacterium]|nr:DUF3943 domain-containing protein [Candidatus Krumholzibacteria bacterium]
MTALPGASETTRWGFFFNLGLGDQSGDFADQLHKGTTGEFGILKQQGDWRYGLSLSFGSWGLVAPYDHEPEFGFQRIDLLMGKTFKPGSSWRPYVQGRIGLARLHPRIDGDTGESLFNMDPLPPDFKTGDSPTKASDGFHIGVIPGLEWDLNNSLALDFSLLLDYYVVEKTDLTPVGGPDDASSGFDWQVRLGTLWWTDSGPNGGPAEYDAWGVRKSYGWAIGEAFAINLGASAFNEYVRNANFNQISPRSWYANLQEGLTWDDNQFRTNQIIHPFNGACYYNAARANGVSYWPSYAIGIMGAVQWEWMGETHPMSFNDMISTGIGGAAVGETLYRFSSMILDNQATGKSRFFNEAGGFLVDPIRGFNRILSGQAWKVASNPEDDMDKSPIGSYHDTALGWRRSGNGFYPSLEHDYTDYMFLRYQHEHGTVFDNTRRKPWDYFDTDVQFAADEKNPLIRFNIAGNWWTTSVGEAGEHTHRHMAAFSQHFEYENTFAYEYGGTSIGPTFFSDWGTFHGAHLETRMDILATILAGVSSDYSDSLAVVANQERFREYDYGPGAGARFDVKVSHNDWPILTAGYRL